MSLPLSLDPSFLSDLDSLPADEAALHVEAAAREASLEALENLTSALMDRALRVLRDGSRRDIIDEALVVSRGLSGDPGRALRARHSEIYGAWNALDDLLAEAGRRHDRAAVPALLKSTRGLGQRILEILVREGAAVPRSRIRKELGLAEAHISHLLHDLDEADLVVRFRSGKEIFVELGAVGEEVARTSVLPAWVERFADALSLVEQGEQIDAAELAGELAQAGAPSSLVAERLAKALARVARQVAGLTVSFMMQRKHLLERARIFKEEYQETEPGFVYLSARTWAAPASTGR